MTMTAHGSSPLDQTLHSATLIGAVGFVACAIMSLFFVIIPPAESIAGQVQWLNNNMASYVFGWLVQIGLVLSFSLALAGLTWKLYKTHPVRAIVSWVAVLVALPAFLLPKFTTVWAVPLVARTAAAGGAESEIAKQFLLMMDFALPYSLFSAFDYLGFAGWALSSLLVARQFFSGGIAGKIAGGCIIAFGSFTFVCFAGSLISLWPASDIGAIFEGLGNLIFLGMLSSIFYLRSTRDHAAAPSYA